ncbi:MAG: hypothetical protein ACRC3H_05300 [Lachnospiraceae bacterium]
MIEVLFANPVVYIHETNYVLKAFSLADPESVDVELDSDGNTWATTFNINFVRINGIQFKTGQAMLNFFQEN